MYPATDHITTCVNNTNNTVFNSSAEITCRTLPLRDLYSYSDTFKIDYIFKIDLVANKLC